MVSKLEAKIRYLYHNENAFLMIAPLQARLYFKNSIAHCRTGDQTLLGKMEMALGARTPACMVGTVADAR